MLKLNRLLLYVIIFFSLPLFITSCNTFDPPLNVPIYGHIDSIHFNVPLDSVPKQGSASAYVQYAWVYLDDNPVGAFQLPCTFPMVGSTGTHNIKVYPGVTPAGTNSPAGIYPFYQFYSINLNMQQGKTYKLNPTSAYYTWVQFPYIENFDNESNGTHPTHIANFYGDHGADSPTDTSMYVTDNTKLIYQGRGSGMVIVNQLKPYYIGVTILNYLSDSITNNGTTPAYVEFNYRATAEFTVGLMESDTSVIFSPAAIIFPSTKWNKMYVSLNNSLTSADIRPYNVYFSIKWNSGDPVSDTLLLDNIKIVD